MSSLTSATSSSMGESSQEEFDTRLSLRIGGGAPRPPPVKFDELFPAPSRKKASSEMRGAVTTSARHSKKARTAHDGEERDAGADASGGGGAARKKLRLSAEQAALLESSFRAHNILSHAQKHDLARQLKLSARQVEVWFQNRRARTKLKQTEVDCELLRRWCERLSDENARLRRELADARSSTAVSSLAAAVVCPSCDSLSLGLVAGGAAKMAA